MASPRWALAQTLAERLADRGPRPFDPALAQKRLARWKATGPFAKHPALWDAKLSALGLTEDDLRQILGETPEGRPAWVDVLAAAYGDEGTTPPFPWPAGTDLDRCRFLPLLEPLVWHFCSRLELEVRAILSRHPAAPFDPDIARVFTAYLPDHFAALLNRTLVVEMHVLKLEEQLAGETAGERFADFIRRLRQKTYALEVLEQYPVLAHQAVQRLELWLAACTELLRRLAADAEAIADGAPIGRLHEVHGAISDLHRGGRSVFILGFASGFQIVYKPKPLALEAAFQNLLGWLNARGFAPAFRQVRVLDRGDYGWMEMVRTGPCPDEAALLRFLERQGGYLALLYALDGTDFHHENLLASGEHPILIDLETLFQPWLNTKDLHDVEGTPGAPLRATVLRANLLPERWYGDSANAGVDLSGLTAADGQLTPAPMLATTDEGLDTMHMERRRMRIPVGDNRARVDDGRDLAAHELAAPVEAGFRRMYALLAEHREELIAGLQAFAGCEMRILFRTTMSYGTVQLESLHPHALGNALERDRLFDTLWTSMLRRPWLDALAAAEAEDLHRGDIPLFLSRPGSRDAFHWSGRRYADFFEQSGLERAADRIRGFSTRDLERQVALIRDTFDALRISGPGVKRPSYDLVRRAERPSADELLALACNVADRVVERAFENDAQAHWMMLDYREPGGWSVVPAHPDLWLGLPGIAFFLGHLGAATGQARYTEVARKALFAQRQQLALDAKLTAVGAFNGWGGVIYTLAHLGRLWQDDALLDEAEGYARGLRPLIDADEMCDVIAGSAGCIFSLLALSRARPSAWLDELLLACGERLLAKAEACGAPAAGRPDHRRPAGDRPAAGGPAGQRPALHWKMPLAGNRGLAGISHGAAGIALALLRLHGRTGDARFRDAALGGIAFERSLFDETEQNWPDLRAGAEGVDGKSAHFMWAWCHGAPGIGLARIAGLPWLDDAEVRGEIDDAVRSTIERGFGENHSICHGDLGNLELLFAAGREDEAWRIAGGIADSIRGGGWLGGLPGNIETPGLMAGLSGIGYGLARLAKPELFPRILTLDS
ncbi:MAG TPA: type 2 lanthipeptide synthetase LanM family protein [Thermoanaerobaculia bacterium]|nr:type 2 lanthipeptide synthetase LanM family protein [Thermoanaerobaculia bacterium]